MNHRGYTIAEVLIAVLVVGIGLTAAATLVNSLLGQEQLSASSVRAANLQEQAVMLTRLGMAATDIRAILPETVGASIPPARDEFSFTFVDWTTNLAVAVGAGTTNIAMDVVSVTMIYRSPTPGEDTVASISNTEIVLLPAIR